MAARNPAELAHPGDILLVTHDFNARSPDELSLRRGDKIELIERDDDFGDGWFLGKHQQNGSTGLFPAVYTTLAPRATLNTQARPPHIAPISVAPPTNQTEEPSVLSPSSAYPASPAEFGLPMINDDITAPALTMSMAPMLSESPISTVAPPSSIATQPSVPASANTPAHNRLSTASQRNLNAALGGDPSQSSPVMTETLSVINEHITDMSTPRHSIVASERRGVNDSASEYSGHHRISYINGRETDEEEQELHTEEEVISWSAARVAEYLEDVGADKKHCQIFKEQEITGEVLLAMDQATLLLKEFELGPVGPRLKTWSKIKALQQEVKMAKEVHKEGSAYAPSEESPIEHTRNRSTSIGTVLPRIPSLMDSSSARSSRHTLNRGSSHQVPQIGASADNSSPAIVPPSPARPSAASIRSLNHNRRHSSIDFAVNPPTPLPVEQSSKSQSITQTSHRKQPSFDRGWTMGGQMLQSPTEAIRPSSSTAHAHSISFGGTQSDGPTKEIGMTVVSPSELERGYFSGNEVDNRKGRNVLRKKETPDHSRNPSFSSESIRRTHAKRHSRIGSTDSSREYASPLMSPAMRAYYGAQASPKPSRAMSGPELVKPLHSGKTPSPTVTKLEYSNTPSIDAVANSPALPESDTGSGRASPSPGLHTSLFTKKPRSSGLRAISDIVTGHDKSMASNQSDVAPSPVKESPVQPPSRTNSSTPSGTSKSFELEVSDAASRTAAARAGGLTTVTGGARRKTKKSTSAYTRGLEQKSPKEQMVGCDYSGWMKKKSSNLMTTWKTRLFVLRGRRLSYYYSEFDTEEKGLIDISSHRVLPANDERITGLHATITGATSSPSSPQNASIPTTASTDAAAEDAITARDGKNDAAGMFIFKLVPPRSGLSKAVNFTKPTVHYFAVDNIQQGRLWMAALMKATIDRDENLPVVSTYQQKTISLLKARAMRQRPPALMGDDEDGDVKLAGAGGDIDTKGLAISGLGEDQNSEALPNGEKKSIDGSSGRTGTLSASVSGSLKESLNGVTGTNEAKEILT